MAEKIGRYFHERLQAHETLTNKLRARISSLKAHIVRLEDQLRQKEEMGDTLNEIDFDQLKIENRQYLDKIDEKNIELILLKRRVGKATQILNRYKNDLKTKTNDLIETEQRFDKQQILYEHAQQEVTRASHERSYVVKKHRHLVDQVENFQVPEIIDYVRKKALLYNLQRECQVWQRKNKLVSVRSY